MAPGNLNTALTPKNDRWRIKVEVIRLCEAVNPTMADDFYGQLNTCLYLKAIGEPLQAKN
uniref:Uncharacterized protein n=3 Tax=Oryza TaxID=4527 RepID=A0A0D3FL56_9ORYZ